MKVNLAVSSHNNEDWDRIEAGDFSRPPTFSDASRVEQSLALGDLAEPFGFDGIWALEHFGSPYVMSPNPLQLLGYFAGRTERVSFGTTVLVLPWWNPVRLAHQIAYLDIISKGRFETIGVGRGVAKREFEALGIPRDESRQRFEECLDIIELALTRERFSYQGEIFKIPESSVRPQPRTRDLPSRFYGASATNTSLEVMARRGLKPLFVGNKPLGDATKDVRLVNSFRREMGLPPCQSKNVLFMYCAVTAAEAALSEEYTEKANRSVNLHYAFGDPATYAGVKGYEAYAAGTGSASAVTERQADSGAKKVYDLSNNLIGTPDQIISRIIEGQRACSFSEITVHAALGGMPFEMAERSLRLFAEEVLPVVHKMDAPLHPSALPEREQALQT